MGNQNATHEASRGTVSRTTSSIDKVVRAAETRSRVAERNRHAVKSMDASSFATPDSSAYRYTIMSNFMHIENTLAQLEARIGMLRREMVAHYDQLATKVKVNYGSVDLARQCVLLSQKSASLKVANARRSAHIFRAKKLRLKLVLNKKSFDQHLNEKFFHLSRPLTLSDKIRFFHLLNDYESVDLTRHLSLAKSACYNYAVLPMTRNKIFFCQAVFFKKSFMKITDRKGTELCRRNVPPDLYYRQFMASEDHVVALYDNSTNSACVINIYDDQLNLVAARRFSKRLELVSFNRYTCELICRHLDQRNEYLFIGNFLKSTFLLRLSFRAQSTVQLDVQPDQSTSTTNPAVDSAVLLGASDQNVFLMNLEKKYMKKVSRSTAKPTGFYSIDDDIMEALRSRGNYKLENSTIQLEKSRPVPAYTRNSLMSGSVGNLTAGSAETAEIANEINLVLKVAGPGDDQTLLKCFNQDGVMQVENSNEMLGTFKTIDFTSRNDLFYFNASNKTLYFL